MSLLDVSRVTARLYITGEEMAHAVALFGRLDGQVAELDRLAIVDATGDGNVRVAERFGPRYLHLGHADGVAWTSDELLRFLAFTRQALDRGLDVLVHCSAGLSRSPSLVVCWLMHAGLGWEEAEAMVRRARPEIQVHPELKRSILTHLGLGYRPIGSVGTGSGQGYEQPAAITAYAELRPPGP